MASHLFLFYETDDRLAASNARFIEEAGRTWEIDKKWSVRLDAPHHPKMNSHVHVMLRGNDVCVINRDGTPSHGTSFNQAPNWLLDRLRQRGLIERSALLETASEVREFQIPSDVVQRTEFRARIFDALDQIRQKRFREIARSWPYWRK